MYTQTLNLSIRTLRIQYFASEYLIPILFAPKLARKVASISSAHLSINVSSTVVQKRRTHIIGLRMNRILATSSQTI